MRYRARMVPLALPLGGMAPKITRWRRKRSAGGGWRWLRSRPRSYISAWPISWPRSSGATSTTSPNLPVSTRRRARRLDFRATHQCRARRLRGRRALRHACGRVAARRPGHPKVEHANRRQRPPRPALPGCADQSPFLREAKTGPGVREVRRQECEDAPPCTPLEGARRRGQRPASLAWRGRFRRWPRGQPLHRANHPPHRARHRRGARSLDVGPREREKGRGALFGERRRPDAVFAQRRRRSLFHRWRHRPGRPGLRLRGARGAPRTLIEPPRIEAKNTVFSWLEQLWRKWRD